MLLGGIYENPHVRLPETSFSLPVYRHCERNPKVWFSRFKKDVFVYCQDVKIIKDLRREKICRVFSSFFRFRANKLFYEF